MKGLINSISEQFIFRQVTIAPLVTFRILFGLLMCLSMIRFASYGWISALYIEPDFYFPFIDGVQPLPGWGMYLVFALLTVASIFIMAGLYYRWSTSLFFLLFTYVELIDKTNYLNHYYFISIISFLLIWLPAHRDFSLDVRRGGVRPQRSMAVGCVNILRLQLGIVYFFAGLAKLNADWLLHAQPMKLWLSAQVHQPAIGWIFRYKLTAYLFSWAGMLFDLTIPFFLALRKTLPYAYAAVIGFHLITWWLFPIGMFPWIMIAATTLFFPFSFHEKVLSFFKRLFPAPATGGLQHAAPTPHRMGWVLLSLWMMIQLLIPLRFLAHPGNVFWNEAGYRFSWRVMLMEKAGQTTFYVSQGDKKVAVANYDYLTAQQEKMMATQPDMILQFARFLRQEYLRRGFTDPKITVDSFVTLNGRPSRRFIEPSADLGTAEPDNRTAWVLAYE